MQDTSTPPSLQPRPPTLLEEAFQWLRWVSSHPLESALCTASAAVLLYFFGFYKVFTMGSASTAQWAWFAWNPENNQEHSVIILPISIALVFYHRRRLAAATIEPDDKGLAFLGLGLLCFVLGVWMLQPRLAIFSLPVILFGAARFVWGREVARGLLFPCAFLLFMIPIGGLVQSTVSLQLLVSSVCNTLSHLIGVKIDVNGTTIRSLDGSFNFEIAEGCSGIRSLMAMTTLTALYAHFTQDGIWKKTVLFGGSIVFAIIGNIARIFTVILVARFISPKLAGGIYHDYSGFVFFPVAVTTMVSFGNLLTLDFEKLFKELTASRKPPGNDPGEGPGEGSPGGGEGKPASVISYDY